MMIFVHRCGMKAKARNSKRVYDFFHNASYGENNLDRSIDLSAPNPLGFKIR